jgi:hypothetical protein
LEERKNHSLEMGMLLLLLLSFIEATKACDLVILLIDDGVSIGFGSRKFKKKRSGSLEN